MRSIAAIVSFGPVFIAACTPVSTTRPNVECPSVQAPKAEDTAKADAKEAPKETPGLTISIQPKMQAATIEVSFTVGPAIAAKAKSFSIRHGDPTVIKISDARDARGPIEMSPSLAKDRVIFTPSRLADGELRISYTVQSRVEENKPPWMLSDPDRLEVTGDALLLPDIDDGERVDTSYHVDISTYGTTESGASVSGVASSYGIGSKRNVKASMRELRGVVFVAGRMGTAVFDTLEGHDEAAWFGYTAFDPRPVSADTAAFRTAAAEFFGERSSTPQTLLIVPQPGPSGAFVATRRTQSVLVHVAVADTWSAPLRIATAVETLHAWIGERLWIGPDEPSRAAEGAWFADGFARHLARDMLFRFGLVTPLEVAAEVNSLEAIIAMSPFANETNADLATRTHEAGVVQTIVARGALYALQVDAAIRQKTNQKQSLSDTIRALYKQAKEQRGPLPTTAWIKTMQTELGPKGADAFAAIIEKGGNIDLPTQALGPCFRKESRKFARYDLGFDDVATRSSKPPRIAGVRKDGPAYRAGLRDGDEVVNLQRSPGRSDVAVVITVMRGDKAETIKYEPKGATVTGRGWLRVKDVPDEQCTK